MYLKSIEVHGFKSFANKIDFKFENGITGIVGPNGSGKSNVADAVRWVLGEQRIKQLRGASMQDVIFSGTEMRKPLSYASVAITLDNSDHVLPLDYDEVTVTRRLYRSGESEYLLNGTVCRLKDVNELFYDTGIGKEGYSIIGQGQIDKILSGRPEERRELFDEAAGIVKFKKRKDASVKKLESEEGNLVRVKDILSELEKQVGPLEKQAEVAKVYLKKKEELKSLDVNVFLLENDRIKGQLESVEEKLTTATEEFDETNSKYEHIKEEYAEIEETLQGLNEKIDEAKTKLSDSGILREKLEGEILVLREQINSIRVSESAHNDRLKSIERDIAKRQEDLSGVSEEKKANDEQMKSLNESKSEAVKLLNEERDKIKDLDEKIENGKNTIINELNRRATIKTQIGRYDTMKEQILIRRAELTSKLVEAKSNEEKQDEEIVKLQEDCSKIDKEIEEMNDSLLKQEESVEAIREQLAGKDKDLRDAQVLYHQDKSKLDALSALTERYEGYGNSVRKVMELKNKEKGIVGVVADIFTVDKKYETAIEIALGGNAQNIVTEDEQTAKKMVEYLKKNSFGRATFLPLTTIKDPQTFKNPEALKEEGAIGLAKDLVKVDKKYDDVAATLLGRILVVDTVDNALKIARKYKFSMWIVTIEGEQLAPGGSISGGSFKNNSNFLGRRREIDELNKKIKESLKLMDELVDEIEALKTKRNRMRMEIEDFKVKIQKKYIEQNTAKLNVIAAQEKKNETIKGSHDLKNEEVEIATQLKDIDSNKSDILNELTESEKTEKTVTEDIAKFQEELDATHDKEAGYAKDVAAWELEVNKCYQKQDFVNQNLQRIEDEIKRFEIDANEVRDKIKEGNDNITLKENNIAEIEKTIALGHTTQTKTQTELNENVKTRDNLTLKQKHFFTDREELSSRITALDKEIYRLNTQKEKYTESIETQINYMWEEYEITLVDAKSLRNEDMKELPSMKKQISKVKEEIKKLGDVNVNAIEDYRNLMERYTFLKTQHDDLIEATETLKGIIAELDEAMRKQFTESFKDINNEFDKVFKELFGGGKGTLELIEDEDILEAGIRIIAQPPGKKLQNMMQLSGGEKALTAIALLFAIQNLKPSPFALLDEIEAALDESNVDRFAKYLNKLTKHTQFIVITHRRGTMSKCDRLYGITMQEKGVSALVSVNLIDKDLDD
ncbi:MAG: chromosome segregation protein SMC [Lachnospiraceae bacterium]|nr:chromosome segregation protein SMC [Lachnospiraceae bacterium]